MLQVRQATSLDVRSIVTLIEALARAVDVATPVDEAYFLDYLASPGSGILVADDAGETVGLLSFSMRPSLLHAGRSCVIEELVVDQATQRQGIADRLVEELLSHAAAWGCIEVSVTALTPQRGAIEFYKSQGFSDDAVFLEKHLRAGEERATPPRTRAPE